MVIRHQERELMPAILDRLLAAGKTQADIAAGTHIPSQRLHEIAGGAEPTLYELKLLAKFADVRLSDLVNDKLESDQVRVLLRRTPRRRAVEADPAEPFVRKVVKIAGFLPSDYRSPEWTWPTSQHRNRADAEADAEAFRSAYFAGDPVSPLLDLPRRAVEDAGVLLFVSSNRELDGLSCGVNRRRFVMLAPRFPPRMLYTLAHEIGHHAAHVSSRRTSSPPTRTRKTPRFDMKTPQANATQPLSRQHSFCRVPASGLPLIAFANKSRPSAPSLGTSRSSIWLMFRHQLPGRSPPLRRPAPDSTRQRMGALREPVSELRQPGETSA